MLRRLPGKSVIALLLGCAVNSAGQVLEVPEVIQEQTEWCWAAASCCVLRYYGTTLAQCTIADYARTHATWHNFGSSSCCETPVKSCNYWNYNYGYAGSIEDILKAWGVMSRGTGLFLTLDKIRGELGAGRPFIIRWALKPSGGHFIVGHGVKDSTIYYMNPWRGEGYKIADYSWVLSNSSHTWQGTNVMTTTPSVTVALAAPRARIAASGRPTNNGFSISYTVPFASPVSITVHTLRGELLRTVSRSYHQAGCHAETIAWVNFPAGGCVLSVHTGAYRASTLMVGGCER